MKKYILSIAILVIGFTACKEDNSTEKVGRQGLVQTTSDTTGFAAYKEEQAKKLQAADQLKTDSLQILKDSIKDIHQDLAEKSENNETRAEKSSSANTSSASTSKNSTTATTVKKKKGMSKATKGTLIGAGTGALTGALVTKHKRGIGALVGGAVGGGTGYLIGKSQDKKDKAKKDE